MGGAGLIYFNAGSTPGSVLYNGTDFATYSSTLGVTPAFSTTVAAGGSITSYTNYTLLGSVSSGANSISSLKMAPTSSGQALTLSGTLQTNGVLLTGSNDYSIIGSQLTTSNIFVTSPQTTLSIGSVIQPAWQGAINFSGGGFVTLTGKTNQLPYGGGTINLLSTARSCFLARGLAFT